MSTVIGTGLLLDRLPGRLGRAAQLRHRHRDGRGVAWWRRGWLDTWFPSTFAFLGAFPYFWLAMVTLYIFGFTLGWFPLGHAYADDLTPGLMPRSW